MAALTRLLICALAFSSAYCDCFAESEIEEELTAREHFNKGIVYFNKHEYDHSIIQFTKAIQMNPQFCDAFKQRGNAFLKIGDYERAIWDYDRAIELNPKYPNLYLNRGSAYLRLDNTEKAIADYTKALELDPAFTMVYEGRANVYRDLHEYDKAIADYTRIIELEPTNAKAFYKRGYMYLEKKEYTKAINSFNSALSLNPKYYNARFDRALAFSGKGDLDRAISEYDKLIKEYPDNSNTYLAYNNRGYEYFMKGDNESAIKDYYASLLLNPYSVDTWDNIGISYYLTGRIDLAKDAFEKAIALGSVCYECYLYLSEIYEKEGNKEKADMYRWAGQKYKKQGEQE
ncbi:MAG TPA: tetratricopeptide repeat protein [Candidatus Omnitrophota bacterium]|nr:tetratricopeptide repeat protein [Candidatus Omnitrophota bacterium]HOX09465.1 tetratricopeptide repeat protein [Candidatus Omnitrophota bacterium]HRZ66519.1 tetratricopeptide repeat protein [Candidatus Omnitrophota bacterium]